MDMDRYEFAIGDDVVEFKRRINELNKVDGYECMEATFFYYDGRYFIMMDRKRVTNVEAHCKDVDNY